MVIQNGIISSRDEKRHYTDSPRRSSIDFPSSPMDDFDFLFFSFFAHAHAHDRALIDLRGLSSRALTEKRPGSSDLQLVQQHSARWHCLNAMVSDREIENLNSAPTSTFSSPFDPSLPRRDSTLRLSRARVRSLADENESIRRDRPGRESFIGEFGDGHNIAGPAIASMTRNLDRLSLQLRK